MEKMIACEIIAIVVATAFYFSKVRDPLKLMFISWFTLAILSALPCKTFLSELALQKIKHIVNVHDYTSLCCGIFINNMLVDIFTFILGPLYLGYVVATTSFVAHQLAQGYPLSVVLGAHTVLELYAYSLSATRKWENLLKSIIYLLLAAIIESWFILKP